MLPFSPDILNSEPSTIFAGPRDLENPFEIYHAAEGMIEMLPKLFARLVGRLCEFAEKVESAVGLAPLQAPI